VHKYVSTGLANSKFGIRNSKLQVRTPDVPPLFSPLDDMCPAAMMTSRA